MAALQCEICGGKLVGKPGGVFECDSCGMEYSTAWAKAKIQEIKGTVKVEGTVEVQGTVKVDGPIEIRSNARKNSYLKRGFMALEDRQWKQAKSFFNNALTEDAECAEAYLGLAIAQIEIWSREDFVVILIDRIERYFDALKEFSDDISELLVLGKLELEEENTLIQKYSVPKILDTGRMRNIVQRSLQYVSWIPEIRKRQEFALSALNDNDALNRAIQFASPEIKEEIEGWKSQIRAYYEEEIRKDRQAYEAALWKFENNYEQWISEKEKEFAKLHWEASRQKVLLDDLNCTPRSNSWIRSMTAPLSAGKRFSSLLALKSDGTAVIAKQRFVFRECGAWTAEVDLSSWSDIISVAGGWSHVVGLKSDGTVVASWATGSDTVFLGDTEYRGQCDVSDWTDVVAIAAGNNMTVGLKSDGTLLQTGEKSAWLGGRERKRRSNQPDTSGWSDIVDVIVEDGDITALCADGTVISTYENYKNISEWRDVIAIIGTGYGDLAGLCADGTVVFEGSYGYGRRKVEEWTDIVSVSISYDTIYGLRSNGTVVYAGRDYTSAVYGWENIVAISAGYDHLLGLREDGTVLISGKKCSDEDAKAISEWKNIISIMAGPLNIGIRADGKLEVLGRQEDMRFLGNQLEKWKLFEDVDDLLSTMRRRENTKQKLLAQGRIRMEEEKAREVERRAKEEAERKNRNQACYAKLKSEEQTLKAELLKLKGLFTGKRRREIEARLTEIQAKLTELEKKL